MNEQVRQGTLQMTKTLSANLTAFDKRIGVLSLPYLFAKQDDLFTALAGELGKQLGAILETYDLKVLAFFDSGSRNIYNTKRRDPHPGRPQGPAHPGAAGPGRHRHLQHARRAGHPAGHHRDLLGAAAGRDRRRREQPDLLRDQQARRGGQVLVLDPPPVRHRHGAGQQEVVRRPAGRRAGRAGPGRHRRRSSANGSCGWRRPTKYIKQAEDKGATINDDVDIAAFQTAVKPVLDKHRADVRRPAQAAAGGLSA